MSTHTQTQNSGHAHTNTNSSAPVPVVNPYVSIINHQVPLSPGREGFWAAALQQMSPRASVSEVRRTFDDRMETDSNCSSDDNGSNARRSLASSWAGFDAQPLPISEDYTGRHSMSGPVLESTLSAPEGFELTKSRSMSDAVPRGHHGQRSRSQTVAVVDSQSTPNIFARAGVSPPQHRMRSMSLATGGALPHKPSERRPAPKKSDPFGKGTYVVSSSPFGLG
eukprot:TRINITY_DN16901_c0_g1_i1.p1 TRINITY_DN16901_c0_g1~~TRINITY_DN16901_c0_g1_i1.p1  ORF type:complete len:223 (+),score=14.48 TRINITY_DN16901_c0_g1_i1:103-771(+)